MPATTPEQLHELWTEAFTRHNLTALLALYEPNAVLAPSPGESFEGQAAIQSALESFLALKPSFKMRNVGTVRSGDLAILFSKWELVGTGPDGSEVRMEGVTADVVRQQPDGHWLMVIDNPFGGAIPATS